MTRDIVQPPWGVRSYVAAISMGALTLLLLPYCSRYSTGDHRDYVGRLVSQGMSETGGGGLDGRNARWATVDLPDGRRISAGIKRGLYLAPGETVIVREAKMNVGATEFAVIGLADAESANSGEVH